MTDQQQETEGTPASEGDFTGTATGADGADNVNTGEPVPTGDEAGPTVLGETFAA